MAKTAKETVYMVSTAGTGFFYINRKNKKKFKGDSKINLKKYDPIARKHVLFEEKKLSKKKKLVAAPKAEAKPEEQAKA